MQVIRLEWFSEMNKIKNLKENESGWFLISVIVMMLFLTSIGLSLAWLVALQFQHTKLEEQDQNTQLTAEAGIEQSVYQLNQNNTFTGFSSAQTFFNDSTQGMGTFTSTITTNSDGTSKTIISTANLYLNGSSTPYLTRKIKVIVVGTNSSGDGVVTGPGGLIMSGEANFTNANLDVGGTLTMSGSAIIGTPTVPVTVDVANDSCPSGPNPGSTFPQVCSGTQPISMSGTSLIYGSVCATGQTTNPNNAIQPGTGGQGLESGCVAPVPSQPTYDRQSQINAVSTTASGSSTTYVCGSGTNTSNWPANLKLTGNVSISSHCEITLNGPVWITGNLVFGGSSAFIVSPSVGTTTPIIMVDGTINLHGSATVDANASKTSVEFIDFECSLSNVVTEGCSSASSTVTGTDLYNSSRVNTISVNGSANVPGVVFDAYWSEVTLSGSGNMGAAIGQTVDLAGGGTVISGTILNTGSLTWTITSYQPLY